MLLHLDLCHPIKVIVIVPITVENWIWGDGNGTELSVMLTVQGFIRCDTRSLWLVIIHTQIYGSVHGANTHENSTTMSLYGYGLA
jgi:hypothetical protein